jgi:hypothetical protein
MHDRIDNGANLLKDHVFQFDFLNDEFDKLPEGLQDIINDENKRKKLVIYINPPYAEASNKRDSKNAKIDVNRSLIEKRYLDSIGKSVREIYVLFMTRVYKEISNCKLAQFSKLKFITSPNFTAFRTIFNAKFRRGFVIRANTFDNVSGQFPIAFSIWDLSKKASFRKISCDVVENAHNLFGQRCFFAYNSGTKYLNDWLKQFIDKEAKNEIAAMCCIGNDFQHNIYVNINHRNQLKGAGNAKGIAKFGITKNNLILAGVYFTVRKVIPANWLNDRDQFLYPNDAWKSDREFRNDCLAYTLFNNNIQSQYGVNHWIPFTEAEINAKSKFKSNFMTDFIAGKIERTNGNLFSNGNGKKRKKIVFSAEAKAVFRAGRKLWTYYHSQKKCNVNASLYDIREHFQGRNASGKMNNKSNDETYNALIADLRLALKTLAVKIEPRVYD